MKCYFEQCIRQRSVWHGNYYRVECKSELPYSEYNQIGRPPSPRQIPASVKTKNSGEGDPWGDKLSKHQIGIWRAASATSLHGQGWREKSVFSQTPVWYDPKLLLRRPLAPRGKVPVNLTFTGFQTGSGQTFCFIEVP